MAKVLCASSSAALEHWHSGGAWIMVAHVLVYPEPKGEQGEGPGESWLPPPESRRVASRQRERCKCNGAGPWAARFTQVSARVRGEVVGSGESRHLSCLHCPRQKSKESR